MILLYALHVVLLRHRKPNFKLGESLLYAKFTRSNKNKKKLDVTTISVVYEGVNADGKTHIVRMKDGTKMAVHDSYLQKHLQPSFDNIPQTPLDYKNEVGTGIFSRRSAAFSSADYSIASPAGASLLAPSPLPPQLQEIIHTCSSRCPT